MTGLILEPSPCKNCSLNQTRYETTPGINPNPLPEPVQSPVAREECIQAPPIGAPDDNCRTKTGIMRMVFSSDCTNELQNKAIGDVLAEAVDAGTQISTIIDDDCGIIFWTGQLTDDRVKELRNTNGVLAVEDDFPIDLEETSSSSIDQGSVYDGASQRKRSNTRRNRTEFGPASSTTKKKNNKKDWGLSYKKRDTTLVVQDPGTTPLDLAFVSAAPEEALGEEGSQHIYHQAAGEDITVYVVDTGAQTENSEFASGVIKRWSYANDCPPAEIDDYPGGHGICGASKVAGVNFGVAKKASLIIVRVKTNVSSMLSGYVKVLNDLRQRKRAGGEHIPGYNIVTTSINAVIGSESEWRTTLTTMTSLISTIMNSYGVVFVCAAGNRGPEDLAKNVVPASFSQKLPIITVGSVDPATGLRRPTSPGGPLITIYAPGLVKCASPTTPGGRVKDGTSYAAPMVAGLAAYFLSLPDDGDMIRRYPTGAIPGVMKEHIIDKAYVRQGGTDQAIWNGLSSLRTGF